MASHLRFANWLLAILFKTQELGKQTVAGGLVVVGVLEPDGNETVELLSLDAGDGREGRNLLRGGKGEQAKTDNGEVLHDCGC